MTTAHGRPAISFGLTGWKRVRVLLALLAACGSACSPEGTGSEGNDNSRTVTVTTEEVVARTMHRTVSAIGTLESPDAVEIRPEVDGIVLEVGFEEGGKVKRGQVLYQLDDAVLEKQLAARRGALDEAKARLTNAEWHFKRMKELAEQDVARPEELKNVRDAFKEAEAAFRRMTSEVEAAAERLEDATITAPVAGIMSESQVEPGDYAERGDEIATLYPLSRLEVTFTVPERHSDAITVGMPVRVTVVAFADEAFSGEITYVAPAVDPGTRDLTCKARIDNTERLLRPGMFGDVQVVIEVHSDVPVVPEEALVRTRSGSIVYVVEDGRAVKREVTIGLREAGLVEIREGVTAGESVVGTGHMRLQDGTPVAVADASQETASGGEPAKETTKDQSAKDRDRGSTSGGSGPDRGED